MNTEKKISTKFVLSRKNQKGQVAIFVALIFQVVFVFFALLINVGLLVHHKINLQQSTDLAAYYGAMKQAEMMNAVSHINFQIRQSWKLLTWRYRVLGTFGFQNDRQGGISQHFPFDSSSGDFLYNAEVETKCGPNTGAAAGLGVQDIPFFCVGHGGFKGWRNAGDTSCQINCGNFLHARPIDFIRGINPVQLPTYGATVAKPINDAINAVNNNNLQLCADLSKFGTTIFARFLTAYVIDVMQRKQTIEMLASDLSAAADQQVDLDGGKILDGVKKTLANNLTEANKTGLDPNITTMNGLSQGDCAYENGKASNSKKEFLKKIEFDFVNYFIHHCEDIAGSPNYVPKNLYTAQGRLNPVFNVDPTIKSYLEAVFNEDGKHIIGFEKNPACVEYYAEKASATPKIPFLPISAVQLNAISVFKPFGGSIGPRYGKEWPSGSSKSQYTDSLQDTKTDQTLPLRDPPDAATIVNIFGSTRQIPNFSLFVGDKLGVSDSRYIAAYHSMLAKRDIQAQDFFTPDLNSTDPSRLSPGSTWPAYTNWTNIESYANPQAYDSLAEEKSGTRALEIAAVAPNQFDLTYYSIEPDFYNNYFVKLYRNFDAIKSAAGGRGPASRDNLLTDLGGKVDTSIAGLPNQPHKPPLNTATFSVKDQIYLKNLIFQNNPSKRLPNGPAKYEDHFPYMANTQSGLLTGWTFTSFSNYDEFPNTFTDGRTMPFAQCKDSWNSMGDMYAPEVFETPKKLNEQFPPTPGNCVTGGRTGYSVKMVTPALLGPAPPSGSEPILNPIPPGFLDF